MMSREKSLCSVNDKQCHGNESIFRSSDRLPLFGSIEIISASIGRSAFFSSLQPSCTNRTRMTMAGRMDLIIDKVLGHMWLYFSLLLRILISKTNRSRKPKEPKALVKNFQLGKFSIPTWIVY